MSTHNLCLLGGISILLFCGISLVVFLYSYFAVFSFDAGISLRIRAVWSGHSFPQPMFPWWYEKKILSSYFVVFPLMRGISLRIRAVWSGRSFAAYLVFTYATKIPFLMSQYLYKCRSRFTRNVVLLNIIKQNHCEIWHQAKLQIRKIFSYFSMNIYNVFNH